ncbi:FG-GAP repeat protein [bacterium]|nr:FG-GAP repeat protein [bacterium]
MKRVGFVLVAAVAMLVIFTIAMAQLETRSAKHLLRVISGETVRGYFGSGVEGMYAWTGDKPLFAVSSSGEVNGPIRSGKVMFFDGLLADNPIHEFSAPKEGEVFGRTLSGGGDWNGDGIPDLAVGAPGDRESAGKVYLYFGGANIGSTVNGELSAKEVGDQFGTAISLHHDLNGDGLADLVVGAPKSAKAGATAGRAYIWLGKKDGTPAASPDIEIKLGTTNDLFGTAIATGDVTGDGHADLVIGSPHHNLGEKLPGSIFVIHGGPEANLASVKKIISGESSGFQDEFGYGVAIVNDMNDDGASEIVVGAPKVLRDGKQIGKAYLYYGGAAMASEPSRTFWGADEAGGFGEAVFALGDLNRDGKGDWAVQASSAAGSRGTVYFYYGGWEKDFYQFNGEMLSDQLGNAVVALGDVEGNESVQVLVGARWNDTEAENAGRIYILSFD